MSIGAHPISRRNFLRQSSILAGAAFIPGLLSNCSTQLGMKPNILLIMADDMGISDIGCYGGEIDTPNLDQLATNGLRFTQFYNGARCCPTRASLLTGLYAHQTGVGHMMLDHELPGYRGDLNERCFTIPEVMKSAGYTNYMSGKWHVTRYMDPDGPKHNWPLQRGFDHFYGTILGAGSFYNPVTLAEGNDFLETPQGDFYYTDAISDKAVEYIDGHSEDNPFFMYVSYTAPHWPLHAFEEDIEKYAGRYDQGWDALRAERYERMKKMGLIDEDWELTERDPRIPPWAEAENKEWQSRRMEVYAAQIDRMDQGIGRILDALQKKNALDNTLIFFLADNGGCAEELSEHWSGDFITWKTRDGEEVAVGNKPGVMPGAEDTYQSYGVPWANVSDTPYRLYKHYVHEGGIASPLIVHWPDGISAKDEFRDEPGHLIDIMSTCVDVGGADYPVDMNDQDIHPMEGKSLIPVFNNEPLNRDALFWEHEGNRAVRMGDWKLVARQRGGSNEWELYNLAADRTETENLAGDQPGRVEDMKKQWMDWANRVNALPWPWEADPI
jgi:arylsulfatase